MRYLILVETVEEEADFVILKKDVSVVSQVSFEIKANASWLFVIMHPSAHKIQMKCILRHRVLLLASKLY